LLWYNGWMRFFPVYAAFFFLLGLLLALLLCGWAHKDAERVHSQVPLEPIRYYEL
jgi:hypothetical protein